MTSRVQINYQSGLSMVIKCDNFKVTRKDTEIVALEWDNAKPRPLDIGIDHIESVWELT